MSFLTQFSLANRTALITGGSRGLGLEIATALAEAGARVCLFARREKYFEEARGALPQALCVVGDVTQAADLQRAVAETTQRFAPPTILVNAAGISWGAPAMEMPEAKIHEVLSVNITGAFLAAQAVAPTMREAGGGGDPQHRLDRGAQGDAAGGA